MNDIPILHETKLDEHEVKYFQRAVQAGIMSTEILHVLALQRISNFNLQQLVGAMVTPNFIVYRLSPDDIQKVYTILKGAMRNTVLPVPGMMRDDNHTQE